MNILVTGGAGFIGSHLVERLLRAGHNVRVLDNLVTGRHGNLARVARDIEWLEGDCADAERAAAATRGIEVVYHEAALPSVARSVRDPLESHRAGPTATLNLLVAARNAGVRRFLFAGSSSVYGDDPVLPKDEAAAPRPLSPYAAGKLLGEQYVRIYAQLHGMETLTLRYFNVFGPRQDASSPYSGVISLFLKALVSGHELVVCGDGLQSRDFTFVEDAVSANVLALRAPGLSGQAVNVAGGRRVTLLELIATLAKVTGRVPHVRHTAARPGDVRHSLADLGRARDLLGYRPLVDIETGLRRTFEWFCASESTRRVAS